MEKSFNGEQTEYLIQEIIVLRAELEKKIKTKYSFCEMIYSTEQRTLS